MLISGFVKQPRINLYRRGKLYDSALVYHGVNNRIHARLVLECKVKFYAVDPGTQQLFMPDRGGKALPPSMIAWSGTFINWKTSLIRMVENFWDNRMWLIPKGNMGFDWRDRDEAVYRPAIQCGFRLTEVTSGEHTKVACIRLPTGGDATSFWLPSQKTLWLDSEDTKMPTKKGSNQQRAALHEFGHAMGLPHVNHASIECIWGGITSREGRNAHECYGLVGTPQANDVMGRGEQIATWHGKLWRDRIYRHLHLHRLTPFRVTLRRPKPAMVSPPKSHPGLTYLFP